MRSKDQVEVDFLVQLPNQKYIAIEVKTTPIDLSPAQLNRCSSAIPAAYGQVSRAICQGAARDLQLTHAENL